MFFVILIIMKKEKGFIGIALLIIVALGIIGGGTYVYNKNKVVVENKNTATTTQTESSNNESNSEVAVKTETQATIIIPSGAPAGSNQRSAAQKIAANAAIRSVMGNISAIAEVLEGGYKNLCVNGKINTAADAGLASDVKVILVSQDASSQEEANITCVSSENAYAVSIALDEQARSANVVSYCISAEDSYSAKENKQADAATQTCK